MILLIKKHPLAVFFALTYLLNWLGMAANVAGIFPALGEWPLRYGDQVVAIFRGRRTLLNWSPNIAALIVLAGTSGRAGIRDFFKKFLIWHTGWRMWGMVIFLPLLMAGSTLGLFKLWGGHLNTGNGQHLLPVFFLRQVFSLSTGGLGEEGGWRGFALPKLENRLGPLKASLVIGLLWAFLHAPMWVSRAEGRDDMVLFILTVVSLSVILTWFYYFSQGSVLMVALAHNQFNVLDATLARGVAGVLPVDFYRLYFAVVAAATAALMITVTKGRLGAHCSARGDLC